jgi:hypothetical protein
MRTATLRLVPPAGRRGAFGAGAVPVRAQTADKPAMHVGDSWSYAQTTDTGKGPSESAWSRKVVAVGADGGFDFQIGERVHKYDAAGNYLDPKGPSTTARSTSSRCRSGPSGRTSRSSGRR